MGSNRIRMPQVFTSIKYRNVHFVMPTARQLYHMFEWLRYFPNPEHNSKFSGDSSYWYHQQHRANAGTE